MTGLRRLWRGDLPLEEAFWSWAVLGGIAVNLLTSVVFWILVALDQLMAAYVVGYLLSVPYNVAVMVGVWRSAGRPDAHPRRANAYRMITVVAMTILSVT